MELFGAKDKKFKYADWQPLVTPVILDLVDDWGFDRRHEGDAWFEFRERRRFVTGGG